MPAPAESSEEIKKATNMSFLENFLTQLQQIRHKKGGKRAKIRQVKVVTH